MKSRLDALLRQRELLREHARWLDEEIAAERARTAAPTSAPRPPASPLSAASSDPSASAAAVTPGTADTTTLLPAEADVKGLHNEVRRGCLLYFVLALATLAGLIAIIYWRYDSMPQELPPTDVRPAAEPANASDAPR